jgi:CubicO group peptidase (beta-lactamase class C family)
MQQNDRHIYSRAEPPLRVQRTTCLGLLTKPITTVTAMMLFEQGKLAADRSRG